MLTVVALLLTTMAIQPALAQEKKTLKKVLELKIEGEGGANGAAVVYNPVAKLYYAAIAGNISYPLEVFDAKGKLVTDGQLETGADVRGLWYSPATKTLQANTYDEGGWVSYKLNGKGIPGEPSTLFSGMRQPHAQSFGSFDEKAELVYFLYALTVHIYDAKTGNELKQVELFPELDEEEALEMQEAYNKTVVMATGKRGKEFMLLNLGKNTIETFNLDGQKVESVAVPEGVQLYPMFNASFTNGMVWFFNKETRVWTAYK
jgi:hypothetical protein